MIELALATAAIAMLVTKSRVCRILQFGYLMRCPICFGTWTAFVLTFGFYQGHPADLIVKSFGVLALSVVPMLWINYFMEQIDEEIHDSPSSSL